MEYGDLVKIQDEHYGIVVGYLLGRGQWIVLMADGKVEYYHQTYFTHVMLPDRVTVCSFPELATAYNQRLG